MEADRVEHLKLIQGVIARLAGNSFLLKGWTVTLSAALLALAAKDADRSFALVALYPAAAFWGLDAYFLRQERLFRALYDDVRRSESADVGGPEPFSMAANGYGKAAGSWGSCLWRPTVAFVHGVVLGTIVLVSTLTG
jgi:hypothetical protein